MNNLQIHVQWTWKSSFRVYWPLFVNWFNLQNVIKINWSKLIKLFDLKYLSINSTLLAHRNKNCLARSCYKLSLIYFKPGIFLLKSTKEWLSTKLLSDDSKHLFKPYFKCMVKIIQLFEFCFRCVFTMNFFQSQYNLNLIILMLCFEEIYPRFIQTFVIKNLFRLMLSTS